MTADIAAFIRARLDEWEALARDARGPHWLASPSGVLSPQPGAANLQIVPAHTIMQGDAAHIVTHDPASVLRQVAALRAVVDEYVARDEDVDLMLGHGDPLRQREWSGLRVAVRYIAAIWADHPDYDSAWEA